MFCEKCGREMKDGERFCQNCGAPAAASLEPMESSAKAASLEPTKSSGKVASLEPTKTVEQAESLESEERDGQAVALETMESVEAEVSTEPVKKQFTANRKILCMVIGIVVVALAGFGIAYATMPGLQMKVMGPQKYYVKAELKSVESASDSIFSLLSYDFDTPFEMNTQLKINTANLTVPDGSEELKALLGKTALELDVLYDPKQDLSSFRYGWSCNGETIGDLLMKSTKEHSSISFPSLGDGEFTMGSLQWYVNLCMGSDEEIKAMTGYSKKEITDLIRDFIMKGIVEAIPADTATIGKKPYHGMECDTALFTIGSGEMADLFNSMADQLENDPRYKAVYLNAVRYSEEKINGIYRELDEEVYFPTEQEAQEEFSELIYDLRTSADTIREDFLILYEVYYDKKGTVAARCFTDDYGDSVLLGTYQQGADTIMELDVNDGEYVLQNGCISQGNLVEGYIAYGDYYSDKMVRILDYNMEKDAKVNGVPIMLGTMTLRLDSEIMQEVTYYDSDYFEMTITNERDGDQGVKGSFAFKGRIYDDAFHLEILSESTIDSDPDTSKVTVPADGTLTESKLKEFMYRFEENLRNAYPEFFEMAGYGSEDDYYEEGWDTYDDSEMW